MGCIQRHIEHEGPWTDEAQGLFSFSAWRLFEQERFLALETPEKNARKRALSEGIDLTACPSSRSLSKPLRQPRHLKKKA